MELKVGKERKIFGVQEGESRGLTRRKGRTEMLVEEWQVGNFTALGPLIAFVTASLFSLEICPPTSRRLCHRRSNAHEGFAVLTALVIKSCIFWDITPCSPLKVNLRFGVTCRLHLQGQRISRARNQCESRALLAACFHAGFLLGLFFDPEDGGYMCLRNAD
jgi:hypothetical protein